MSTSKTKKAARRREFGTIRQLKSGRWQVRYVDHKGVMRPDHTTYATKKEAQDRLVELRAQLRPGGGYHPVEAGAVRFDVYCESWLKDRRVKGRPLEPGTVGLYRHQLDKHVIPALGALELRRITPERIERWHAGLTDERGAGPVGAPKVYRLVRAILNTAATRHKHYAENPCQIPGAGQEHITPRPDLSRADALKIANAVPDRWRCLVLTALGAGLRFGELAALTRDDIDFDRGVIHVRRSAVQLRGREPGKNRHVGKPKTDAGRRTVAMPPSLAADLARHLDAYTAPDADSWVFVGPKGAPVQSANFGAKVWRPTVAKLGLTGVHIHDLRATSATRAAEKGATVAELMRRLGHTTPDMAMRYQRASDSRDAMLARAMDEDSPIAA